MIAVSNKIKSDEIKDYAGLSQNSAVSGGYAYGIPAFLGRDTSFGRLYRQVLYLQRGDKEGFIFLAIAAVINSVIAAYYYFIIIKTMYLDKPQKQIEIRPSLALNLALILLLIFTIACGLYPQPLINLSSCALNINLP